MSRISSTSVSAIHYKSMVLDSTKRLVLACRESITICQRGMSIREADAEKFRMLKISKYRRYEMSETRDTMIFVVAFSISILLHFIIFDSSEWIIFILMNFLK